MDSDNDLKARILYLLRANLFHSAQALSVEGVRKFPADNVYQMYNGWALALGGRPQEAIRELDHLSSDKDVSLGATIALLHAHKLCSTVDQEAVSALDARLREERRSAGETQLYHAAYFLSLTGRGGGERAKEYADRLLKTSPQSAKGLAVRGWIELRLLQEAKGDRNVRARNAVDYFSRALDQDRGHLDAAFGGVRAREWLGEHTVAMNVLNQIVVRFPSVTPPLIEKMRHQLAQREWGQASDTAARALAIDVNCVEALQMNAIVLLCRDGDYEEGAQAVRRLGEALEKVEPKNTRLYLENAQLCSRCCGRSAAVLAETLRLVERAARADTGPGSAESAQELGQQCLLLGRPKDAARHYKAATRADQSSVEALAGLTAVLLAGDGPDLVQVRQQVEFLREVQGDQPTTDVLLMAARLSAGDPEQALKLLDAAVEAHLKALEGELFSAAYLCALNPDLLLQVVREYQRHASDDPPVTEDTTAPVPALKQCLSVLLTLRDACPGLLAAHLALARTQILAGQVRSAHATIRHVLENVDATSAEAHLLLAQALIRQDNLSAAAQSLEVAVSYNFAIRERPLFHLLSGCVQRARGQLEESQKSLTAAQALGGLRPGSSAARGVSVVLGENLTRSDQAAVLLELAALHQQAGRWPEALMAIQDAAERFKDSAEEGRVAITHADILLARGDVNSSLSVLGSVRPRQPYYLQARHKMADVHLRVRKDKRAYAEVFRQLVDHEPGPLSLTLLGDAYMAVQEPEKAIETYEQALRKNPRNSALACKTGRALVTTHQYGKALNYYREAVRERERPGSELSVGPDCAQLRLDMAGLCIKLGQLEKAQAALAQELSKETPASDLEALAVRVRMYEMHARVRERQGDVAGALVSLQEARQVHTRVLKLTSAREGSDDSPAVLEQRRAGAILCRRMALHAASQRDNMAAVRHYREALLLQASPDGQPTAESSDTLVALAKLYMQINDLEQCHATCQTLLSADAENDAATVMLADLAFRKVDFEDAWMHFSALLERRPGYWTALARLVEVSRRRGQLPSCLPFLDAAEGASRGWGRGGQDPGLSYCRGLYAWYAGNGSQAMQLFNKARRDPEWGQQAVHNMIEICLDPQGGALASSEDTEDRDARQGALSTAERLLAELRGISGGGGPEEELNKRLLANQLLLATGDKRNIEKAVQDLTALVSSETENNREPVGSVLGLANALMLQKQTQRARNHLKRLARAPWTVEQAVHLERAWLLLADLYIQQGKQELASELLRRALDHNQGCTKAYECLGTMSEKESSYREAAQHYEHAWRLGGDRDMGSARSNPALGYKLAYQYMKCKQYAEAIDVCQQVLMAHPNYPRIRKDILDKSRNNLRT